MFKDMVIKIQQIFCADMSCFCPPGHICRYERKCYGNIRLLYSYAYSPFTYVTLVFCVFTNILVLKCLLISIELLIQYHLYHFRQIIMGVFYVMALGTDTHKHNYAMLTLSYLVHSRHSKRMLFIAQEGIGQFYWKHL